MKERNVRMIETNGVRLKVIVEGNGPLLLLLHGFPQCAYLWRNQIDDLVTAGYQVAVPDQRGYGGSDKPAEVAGIRLLTLSADAVGIADALGHETFTLVTHDWGAIVGWHVALLYPQRVNAVFALSVPPTIGTPVGALTRQENFGDNFVYTVYFQQPGVAEAELDADVRKSLRMLYYSVSGDAPAFGSCVPNRPAQRCSTAWSTLIHSRAGSPKRISISSARTTATGSKVRSTGIAASTAASGLPAVCSRPRSRSRPTS